MAIPDSGPTSSYSDPIYDRIDTFAQALKRRWWVYALGLVVMIVIAQGVRLWLTNRPEEASSAAFNAALSAHKPEDRLAKLRELANDEHASTYYRSRAGIELAQDRLEHDDAPAAKQLAEKAFTQADASKDVELQYATRLTRAAAELQLNELDAALTDYGRVESAGARFASQQLEATLGAAAVLAKQGKRDDAIAKLEPLQSRSDAGAESLLDLARLRYWTLKRAAAEAAQPAPTGAQPTTDTTVPAAPAPAPVQGPPAPAPAAPAAAPASAAPTPAK